MIMEGLHAMCKADAFRSQSELVLLLQQLCTLVRIQPLTLRAVSILAADSFLSATVGFHVQYRSWSLLV